MNKKGQALVEFIIILPIMIIILLGIVDYTNMSYKKSRMENILNDISKMKLDNKTDEEINKYINSNIEDTKCVITEDNEYFNIKLTTKYNTLTPGLSKILNNKDIVVERNFLNE